MTVGSITVDTLRQWMENGEVVLVDVREPEEWSASHIPGAVHIPLATVPHTPITVPEGKKLVMQCRSGKRSLTACELLNHLKPAQDVYNLEGGILAWEAAFAK